MPRFGTGRGRFGNSRGRYRGRAKSGRAWTAQRRFGAGRGFAVEMKNVDHTNFPVLCTAAGQVEQLNNIMTGAAYFNRLGTRICLKRLTMHFAITPQGALATLHERLRFLVVYDRQSNGAAPTFANVIGSNDQLGATVANSWDNHLVVNKERFMVLYDSFKSMPAYAIPTGLAYRTSSAGAFPSASYLEVHKSIPLYSLETTYGANAGGVGDLRTGGLFFIAHGEVGTQWGVNFHCRLTFADNC